LTSRNHWSGGFSQPTVFCFIAECKISYSEPPLLLTKPLFRCTVASMKQNGTSFYECTGNYVGPTDWPPSFSIAGLRPAGRYDMGHLGQIRDGNPAARHSDYFIKWGIPVPQALLLDLLSPTLHKTHKTYYFCPKPPRVKCLISPNQLTKSKPQLNSRRVR